MRILLAAVAVASAALTVAAAHWFAGDDPPTGHRPERQAALTSREYALAVTQICGGALLFEEAHRMVTDTDAAAVARDIRTSTERRLARVRAVPPPPALRAAVARWLSLEQRLAESYAAGWIRMHDAIEAAVTPAQLSGLPGRLAELTHASDALRQEAARLGVRLNLPDCTGGERAMTHSPVEQHG
jgi:hypothetical protein